VATGTGGRDDGYAWAVGQGLFRARWVGAVAMAGGVVWVTAAGTLRPLELPLADLLQKSLPRRAATRVAAVLIDERALAALGRWPWSRGRLAELVQRTRAAGAAALVLDILLVEPAGGDDVLQTALAAGPAALVCTLSEEPSRWLLPAPSLRSAATVGHGAVELDHDGVARRLASTKQAEGLAVPALALVAARLVEPSLPVSVGVALVPAFRSPPDTIPRIGAAELLAGKAHPTLTGRVVFIGVSGLGIGDRVVTPVTRGPAPDPGVLVHAAATESLLVGDILHPLPPLLAGLLALLLTLAAMAAFRLGGWLRVCTDVALVLSPTLGALLALHLAGTLVPAITLTATALLLVGSVQLRTGLRAGQVAERTLGLLGAALGRGVPDTERSLAGQLELAEALALEAARRRVASEMSAGVLAHELKTPLTSVRGLAQMVRDLELSPEERQRAAQLLVHEADRLGAMIERLTELERLAQHPFEKHAQRVDLSLLVESRVATLASGYGRRIQLELTPGLEVMGDPRLLEAVFDNLIGNAFKFSPPDSEVVVRATSEGRQAILAVRDHGVGIPPGEQEAIFGRFFRGSSAKGREGMGLGLALVREVVTWHGGWVGVTSRQGEGSTFTVTLPLAEGRTRGEDPGRR